MVMHATHWLIGCTLCITSLGAAAVSAESQNLDSSAATASETGDADSLHESAGTSNNDVLGLMHEGSQRSTSTESSTGTASGDEHPVGTPPAMAPHHAHVGWQSLLPGSIQ